ncbi:MAG: AAA family ATPase [Polyangiaceae bacterium]|nr:AAA family ATPase [Polyangiaceae bacterium]MCW5791950.1 AAA family ATPase [Polyangiaceae bacterium]
MAVQLTRLALSNWRNFRTVSVPLSQRTFVVGPNASGKSNLLDAILFLRDVAARGGGLVRAAHDRGGLEHIRSLHTNVGRVSIEVGVQVDLDPDEWGYLLEVSGAETKGDPLRVERERVTHGAEVLLDRSESNERDPRTLIQTNLEQISQSLAFRPLADALASISHAHVVPQVARAPSRAEEASRCEAPGSDFIDQLARLSEGSQRQALRRIEELLKLAVPRFAELKVERDEHGRPHLEARYEHWQRPGGWQSEREFSDGTLRFIGLLWSIDHGTDPLLLEEPELSLHRDVIRQLPRLFARASLRTGRQVIVSTHAEELISDLGVDPSEILILSPSDGGTTVTLGSEREELRLAAEARIPLGKVVTGITRPKDIEQLSLLTEN